MELVRLTDRIWIYPHEKLRDRPCLGYVLGDRWSLAVDAGHSDDHVSAFYRALERADLPLPSLTVLTHWHWDHTFALHAIHGLSLASEMTNRHLRDVRDRMARDGVGWFLEMDDCIRREYAGGRPVVVTLADMTFAGTMNLDAGGCPIRVFQTDAPHTDDSTLVHVPDEGALFIGDAKSGTFPTWDKDPELCLRLADAIDGTGAEVCVGSHWDPMGRKALVDGLRMG